MEHSSTPTLAQRLEAAAHAFSPGFISINSGVNSCMVCGGMTGSDHIKICRIHAVEAWKDAVAALAHHEVTTGVDIEEIFGLMEKATKGTWIVEYLEGYITGRIFVDPKERLRNSQPVYVVGDTPRGIGVQTKFDAAYMVATRPAALRPLLEELRRRRAQAQEDAKYASALVELLEEQNAPVGLLKERILTWLRSVEARAAGGEAQALKV